MTLADMRYLYYQMPGTILTTLQQFYRHTAACQYKVQLSRPIYLCLYVCSVKFAEKSLKMSLAKVILYLICLVIALQH